jgi:hypothetical protein
VHQAKLDLWNDGHDGYVKCDWCENVISAFSVPDETTMVLWSYATCRPCAERIGLHVSPEPDRR